MKIDLHCHTKKTKSGDSEKRTGRAYCDGVEELLSPGVMLSAQNGSEQSIINIGEGDLVLLTIEVKK